MDKIAQKINREIVMGYVWCTWYADKIDKLRRKFRAHPYKSNTREYDNLRNNLKSCVRAFNNKFQRISTAKEQAAVAGMYMPERLDFYWAEICACYQTVNEG